MPSVCRTPWLLALCLALLAGCGGSDPAADFAARLEAARSLPAATGQGVPAPAIPAILPTPTPASAPAAGAPPAPSASTVITVDQLFDWAERTYPQFFPAGGQPGELQTYRFRYYPSTDLYLAVEGGTRVLLLGAPTSWQLVVVGNLADFAPLVNPAPVAAVATIEPDRLSYLQPTTFRITGTALDANLTVTSRRCSGLALLPGASATEMNLRCTLTAAGANAVGLEFRNAAGVLLATRGYTVPDPQVTISTTLGTLVVELNPTLAPVSTDNFLRYVQARFYDNTIFHRVIAGFVAQGGWLTLTPALAEQAGRRDPIVLESNKGLSNLRGTIAMARTSAPDTATSQFYFNLVDNPALDYTSAASPGYAVFGRIVQGLSVMDAIGASPTANRFGLPNVPTTDVVVQSAVQTR